MLTFVKIEIYVYFFLFLCRINSVYMSGDTSMSISLCRLLKINEFFFGILFIILVVWTRTSYFFTHHNHFTKLFAISKSLVCFLVFVLSNLNLMISCWFFLLHRIENDFHSIQLHLMSSSTTITFTENRKTTASKYISWNFFSSSCVVCVCAFFTIFFLFYDCT